MHVPKRYLAAIVALLAIIAGVLIWVTMSESCSDWRERRSEALDRAITGTADDRHAYGELGKQRPAGCK